MDDEQAEYERLKKRAERFGLEMPVAKAPKAKKTKPEDMTDEEFDKRVARAEEFGYTDPLVEQVKLIRRAKRFGIDIPKATKVTKTPKATKGGKKSFTLNSGLKVVLPGGKKQGKKTRKLE